MSTEWYCPKCGPIPSDEKYMSAVMWRCAKCNARIIEGIPRHVTAMQQQIATLETSLAERWENLNVQDGVVDGLREEIAALRERNAALEKAQTSLAMLVRRLTYALRNNDGAATLRHQAHDYLTRNNLAGDPLREAGYLGGVE